MALFCFIASFINDPLLRIYSTMNLQGLFCMKGRGKKLRLPNCIFVSLWSLGCIMLTLPLSLCEFGSLSWHCAIKSSTYLQWCVWIQLTSGHIYNERTFAVLGLPGIVCFPHPEGVVESPEAEVGIQWLPEKWKLPWRYWVPALPA